MGIILRSVFNFIYLKIIKRSQYITIYLWIEFSFFLPGTSLCTSGCRKSSSIQPTLVCNFNAQFDSLFPQ